MQLTVTLKNDDGATWKVDNVVISDGTLTWSNKDEEVGLDMDEIAEVVLSEQQTAPTLAAEVARLNDLADYLSDVIKDERTKSENRKEVNGILSRRNKKLEAEVERLKNGVECTYCEAVFAIDNPLQFEHWRECDKHPARLEMEQLRAQVEAMREALGPFADCAAVWEDSDQVRAMVIHWSRKNVDNLPDLKITVNDLMAARAALAGGEPPTRDNSASIADFFNGPDESTGKDPYVAFGEWAEEHGYDLEDDAQLTTAIEAYGGK